MAESIQGFRTWRLDSDFDDRDGVAGPPDNADSTARAVRTAADARLQALATGDGGDPCLDFAAPDHDFDRCVRVPIPNPVLFRKEDAGDADAVDSRDVRQDGLGDCHVLASLAALASTSRGRALIRSAIVENRNDGGDVTSWTVTLHRPESHLFGNTTFRDVHITVGGLYVEGHARLRPGDDQNEIWPLVMEKAYAQYAGGYNSIGRGGIPADAMAVLTGHEATYVSLERPNRWFRGYGTNEMQADLANGKMVVLSTRAGIGRKIGPDASLADSQADVDAHRLVASHAYFVRGIERHDGKLLLELGNPWGEADPDPVPCDELTTWFSGVSVGSVP